VGRSSTELTDRGKRRERELALLTRGGEGRAQAWSLEDRRRGAGVTGNEEKTPEEQRQCQSIEENEAWPRARAGEGFLKTVYGRTGQHTVAVR
jgi:hypothetical protein